MARFPRILFYFGVLLILGFVQLQSGCAKQAESRSVAQEQERHESKDSEVHAKRHTAALDDEALHLVSIKYHVSPKLIRRFLIRYDKFKSKFLEKKMQVLLNKNEPARSKPHKSYLPDWNSWMSECSANYSIPKRTLASILIDYRLLTELNQRE